ncbi:predicted protein [Sclerotinia sclerotiorum 1980 UF-70]|uniref:Uncharacterized protein n=1 Tax=Sclerotinia sclerotiorum (strain ATCC 18683 / 1980 / Ss-1) TaxID=665079 RepID=A7ERF1_SCLS1|nr:predicted protein [Sclerotinia sclerotiorum 1980 UF-70]EDN92043.1 predicted protein [Sclerotinia sclerotiorum 1980 UF-70]
MSLYDLGAAYQMSMTKEDKTESFSCISAVDGECEALIGSAWPNIILPMGDHKLLGKCVEVQTATF